MQREDKRMTIADRIARCCGFPIWVVAPLIAAGILFGLPGTPLAHATIGGCRSDPVVTLSDGTVVDLSATIDDASSDVQQVAYTLHAPDGASVVSVVNTDGAIGLKEVFRFYADAPAGTYATTTAVSTATSGIAVSGTTTVVPLAGLSVSGSATGKDQQSLPIQLTL